MEQEGLTRGVGARGDLEENAGSTLGVRMTDSALKYDIAFELTSIDAATASASGRFVVNENGKKVASWPVKNMRIGHTVGVESLKMALVPPAVRWPAQEVSAPSKNVFMTKAAMAAQFEEDATR